MLQTLRIRNLVIVEDVTIELGPGLNVLTGETGAGKSILVDALGLVAGTRADRSAVREGERRAVVEALFDASGREDVAALLAERGLDAADDGQVTIHREVAASGAGRVLINGSPATVPVLRDVAEVLLELHGQHEQQDLLRADRHLELLDRFGDHGTLLEDVARSYRALREARERQASLEQEAGDRQARLEWLVRTARELEALAPEAAELERLDRERRVLQSAGRMSELLEAVIGLTLEGEPAASDLLARAASRAEELAAIDPTLDEIARRLRSAAIEVADLGAAVRDDRERRDFDPARLEGIETRRAAVERQCLLHATDEAGLVQLAADARSEIDRIGSFDEQRSEAAAAAAKHAGHYTTSALALGQARARAAAGLGEAVAAQLADLALASARFAVDLSPARGEAVGGLALGARGAERAELRFTANPGEPLRALQQVASGGELSRVMLALHVVAGDARDRRSVVFDEVDAGISGAVADAVGARLARIALGRQVLCVTHLPQVAAYADVHFNVSKQVRGDRTQTLVTRLGSAEQVEELARLLGGRGASTTSREHAAALLQAARRPAGARAGARRRA